MGLVSMGWATMNMTGMTGAGLQMFSHGAMTALFIGCVGMVYDRAHTRDIPSLGGFMKKMPWVGVAFVVGGLTNMGIPKLAYEIADEEGWIKTGFSAEQAFEVDSGTYPVDKTIIYGQKFGDESHQFVSYIDCLIRAGGGKQSLEEVRLFKYRCVQNCWDSNIRLAELDGF